MSRIEVSCVLACEMSPLTVTLGTSLSSSFLKYSWKDTLIHLVFAHWHVVVTAEEWIGFLVSLEEGTFVIEALHELVGHSLFLAGVVTTQSQILFCPFSIGHVPSPFDFLSFLIPLLLLIPFSLQSLNFSHFPSLVCLLRV